MSIENSARDLSVGKGAFHGNVRVHGSTLTDTLTAYDHVTFQSAATFGSNVILTNGNINAAGSVRSTGSTAGLGTIIDVAPSGALGSATYSGRVFGLVNAGAGFVINVGPASDGTGDHGYSLHFVVVDALADTITLETAPGATFLGTLTEPVVDSGGPTPGTTIINNKSTVVLGTTTPVGTSIEIARLPVGSALYVRAITSTRGCITFTP